MENLILNNVPPHSPDIEKVLLASLLNSEIAMDCILEEVQPAHFYMLQNRIIFEAIQELHEAGKRVDIVLLIEELRNKGKLEKVGGETYISKLFNVVATVNSVTSYIKIIKEKWKLRELLLASSEIASSCFDTEEEPTAIIDEAEQKIFQLSEAETTQKTVPLGFLITNTYHEILATQKSGGITGFKTGFPKLDAMTTGFHAGDLVILAARPGMGKTALMLSMALNTGIRTGNVDPIIIFSIEMTKEQLSQRMLCSEAMVDMQKIRNGTMEKEDNMRINGVLSTLDEAPIHINDSSSITPFYIRSVCRRIKAANKGKLGLIIIDYLQLMEVVGKQESRQVEISKISRMLKDIAKDLQVPIVALSQLSRAVEQRSDKRPILSDLRESGSIEQDADIVMFLYRKAYYLQLEGKAKGTEFEQTKNITELIIGKQRSGPQGTVFLSFSAESTRFDSLDDKLIPQESDF